MLGSFRRISPISAVLRGRYASDMAEQDLERRVFRACEEPKTSKEISEELGENHTAVVQCLIDLKDKGRVEEVKDGGLTKHKVKFGGQINEQLQEGGWTS